MNDARFSPCRRYRYVLTRDVSILNPRLVNFVMLNPSTADATVDDPTIRRCIGYARAWDYGHLVVTNLFALRATDPRALKSEDDPIGPDNGEYIAAWAGRADLVVVAGGGNHRPARAHRTPLKNPMREQGIPHRAWSHAHGLPDLSRATDQDR